MPLSVWRINREGQELEERKGAGSCGPGGRRGPGCEAMPVKVERRDTQGHEEK